MVWIHSQTYDYWWDEDRDDTPGAVFASVQGLDHAQGYRREANLHYLRMYSNRLASGLGGQDYAVQDDGDKIKLNLIKSVIDAATARIATNRPKPQFLTTGGSYSQIVRAKRLNKFISGQFYACRQYDTALQVFADACIFGTGFQKTYEGPDGRIATERVFPDEIIVNDEEAKYGTTRTLYQHKETSKEVLAAAYKKHADEIRSSTLIRSEGYLPQRSEDRVSVIEAWHLPDAPGKKGRHVVCTSEALLVDEPWDRDDFPFSVFRWSVAPLGFWGIGLAEELQSIQVEINYLAQKMQRLLNAATTQLWTRKGDGIVKLDNEDMGHRQYKSSPPVALNVRPYTPEIGAQLEALWRKGFAISGVSQLAAESLKPAGIDSGVALRTYNDIGSQRFQHVQQRWEQYHLDTADRMVAVAREIEESGSGRVKVLAEGDHDVEEIKFSDVSIDKNKYIMRVYPTSLLPDTPSGKVQAITELSQVSPELAPHLLGLLTGVPDLEAVVRTATGPRDLVEKQIEAILDRGEYDPPRPYGDYEMIITQARNAVQRAEVDGVDEDRVELLRLYLSEAERMREQATPPPQSLPAPQAGGAMPAQQLPGVPPPGPPSPGV